MGRISQDCRQFGEAIGTSRVSTSNHGKSCVVPLCGVAYHWTLWFANACRMIQQDALAVFLQRVSPAEQAARINYEELEDAFGDKLVMLQNEPNEYAMCVI